MSTHSLIALLIPNAVYLLVLLCLLCLWSFSKSAPTVLRKARPYLLILAGWTWFTCTPAAADLLLRHLEDDPRNDPAPIVRSEHALVVVLASGELSYDIGEQPRLDANGWERLYEGVGLWRRIGGALLLVGGPAESGERAISVMMKGVAMDLGVPSSAIRLVTESSNTREDLFYAREAIGRNLGPVWLVTSAVHMPRALAVSRALGLSVLPYPVDFRQIRTRSIEAFVPDSRAPARFAIGLREVIGRMVYRIRGWSD
jgi:uncharacterized SAM-binding protein YcdF (DUF218 family)